VILRIAKSVYVCVCAQVYARVCVCVYIYIYIYIYIWFLNNLALYMQGNNKDLDNEDLLCLKCGVVCNVDSRANINREI
jgi:hypothetical protein